MWYVYMLKLRDHAKHSYYIGYTGELKRRLTEHNKGSKKADLIYYEAYQTKALARLREKRLKYYGSAWHGLKKRLNLA